MDRKDNKIHYNHSNDKLSEKKMEFNSRCIPIMHHNLDFYARMRGWLILLTPIKVYYKN